jgi:hypothetical protein
MGLNPDGRGPLNKEEEDILMWCCDALYTGGADTVSSPSFCSPRPLIYSITSLQTVSAMSTFFLMMLVYPEVQRRAQIEIDHVVGKGRLPNIEDQKALPFTMALIKEVLRFAPVVPMGTELLFWIAFIFADALHYKAYRTALHKMTSIRASVSRKELL